MVGRWTVATIGDRVSDLVVYAAGAETWRVTDTSQLARKIYTARAECRDEDNISA